MKKRHRLSKPKTQIYLNQKKEKQVPFRRKRVLFPKILPIRKHRAMKKANKNLEQRNPVLLELRSRDRDKVALNYPLLHF